MKLGSLPKWIHLDCNTINSTLLRVLDIALDMAGFKQQVMKLPTEFLWSLTKGVPDSRDINS